MSENPLLKALIRAHTRKTKDGKIVQVREHHDKRDPAKPKQTKPRAKAQPKLRTPGIKTSAFEMDERKLSALTERVKKLNAAAKRLGIQPITMEITGERWDEAPGRFPTPGMPAEMIPVKMLSVRISGPEPTLADWEFAAVVTPEGNKHLIRRMGDGEDVPARYRSTKAGKRMYCEHCNSARARKKCFILRNTETGEYKMVGSTCIGDFLGHTAGNAEKLAEWYEGFAYLDDYEGAADEADMGDDGFDRPGHYVSAEKYLAHVVALIEQNGWTSRSARYDDSGMATADQALINMIDERKRDDTIPVTEKHWKKARAVRKWLKGLKKEDLTSDYLYNLSVVGKEPAVSMNGIGILASAVVAYEKAKGEELSKKKAAKGEGPKHVGTVGERSTFDVTVVREHVTEGFYGTTYIYGLEDQDGNKLTWFASNPVLEQGQRVKLLATVKAHDEYKGVPQTVITRAKVVEESKLKKALGWLRKALVRAHPMRTASGELTMRRQHSRKGQAQGDPLRQRMDSLGTTDDMQRAAFLTPDGRMVDGGSRGNLLVRNARDEHENLVYWVATGEQPKSAGTDMRLYEAVRKEHFPAVRRAGYMRVNFRPNGVWAIEVHPGVTSAQINAIEQAVKFHAPERLVVGLFNAEGTWAGSDYELEDPSPAEAAGALRRAQASLVAAKPLQKSRPVKGHTRKTPSGKLALIPPHMDKRDPARPEQSTQNAPLAASQPPTYNKRVADNLKHMGAPDGWRSLAIVGMDEGKDLKKKRAMVPQFEPIPEGYTTAPSLYLPSGGIGEQVSIGFGVGATCELCGKQGIKFRYPVVHDGKKWVMWVGSECVTTFGEASGKQQERDHQKDARKSIVLELRDMARQIVQAFADGDRFGRDRNTHPNPSACYDIWNKLNALGRSVTLFGIDTDKEGMAETDRQLQAWLRKNEGYIAALKAAFADLMAMREFRVPLSPDEQKIADKAAATYNEAIAIANAPDTGHGTRFRETIASILRMWGGMSAEDYGYRIVIGQRDKTVQSNHQTLTTQVKQWNAYNGVPVKKGLASLQARTLRKSRQIKAHIMRTASGELTMRRQHTDKRDAAKPRFTEKRVTPKGNVQYVYDEETTEQAKSEKFRRVVNLAKQLPSLIEDLQVALAKGDTPREKVVAAIVALIDRCHFRIGTHEYAERYGTFGVTTLRPEHVTVSGSEVRFQFIGKKQVPWDKTVTDPDLAEFIEHLAAESHGDRLFWYYRDGKQYPIKASHVNAFLSKYGVTAKDLRTYHATKAMFEALKAASRPANAPPLTKREVTARLKSAFDKVAYEMGHTPAVCKTSYVLPQLVDDFIHNGGRLSLSAWEDAVR